MLLEESLERSQFLQHIARRPDANSAWQAVLSLDPDVYGVRAVVVVTEGCAGDAGRSSTQLRRCQLCHRASPRATNSRRCDLPCDSAGTICSRARL